MGASSSREGRGAAAVGQRRTQSFGSPAKPLSAEPSQRIRPVPAKSFQHSNPSSSSPFGKTSLNSLTEIAIGHPIEENILTTLDLAYGHRVSELGYASEGHLCLTDEDLDVAKLSGSSLLYGEVLPHGVAKCLDDEHLRAAHCRRIIDLGSGTGKLCMQSEYYIRPSPLRLGIQVTSEEW
jgi:hypothetical protein